MPLPNFTIEDLLPPGVHAATEIDVQERCVDPFPDSLTRRDIYEGFCGYRRDLEALGVNLTQWVDGSFTDRTRLDPEDIDLVNFAKSSEISGLDVTNQTRAVELLNGREQTKAAYSCHTFLVVIFPLGHPLESHFEGQRKYWRQVWSTPQDYSKPPVKSPAPHRGSKGIIAMTVGDNAKAPTIETRP